MTDVTDLVQRARELLAAATPGPWRVEFNEDEHEIHMAPGFSGPVELHTLEYRHGLYEDDDETRDQFEQAEANAALIVAAPSLIAELADALEAVRRENERLQRCPSGYPNCAWTYGGAR